MIQEEFKELIFKFARHASVDEVAYIFLFGSVANTANKDFENMEVKTRVSELALTLEKEYDRTIQVIFTNKNYDGLDGYFIEEVYKNVKKGLVQELNGKHNRPGMIAVPQKGVRAL